jgi:hypothetical protein
MTVNCFLKKSSELEIDVQESVKPAFIATTPTLLL